MTRREEIKQMAYKLVPKTLSVYDDDLRTKFIQGAIWADAHPIKEDQEIIDAFKSISEDEAREIANNACKDKK